MIKSKCKGRGVFRFEIIRDGKVIKKGKFKNTTTFDGYNKMLNVHFRADTPIVAWYLGLVNNSGYTGSSNLDTMASHSGWAEATGYSETVRQTWAPGAASAGSLSNGTVATFTINATASLNGIFVTSSNTKGGTTGILWSSGSFTTPQAVSNLDVIRITYTFTIT